MTKIAGISHLSIGQNDVLTLRVAKSFGNGAELFSARPKRPLSFVLESVLLLWFVWKEGLLFARSFLVEFKSPRSWISPAGGIACVTAEPPHDQGN